MRVDEPARDLVATTIAWYSEAARPLPWRDPGTTPWAILLSEVMLQQTQVSRGLPVWQTWVERWPSPRDLAAAPLAEVLRAWGRLGYPRRAKRLHEAAGIIVERHGGEVPRGEAELRALPGIGEYTAAAIRAFAFGEPSVVLDTNVRRVIERAVGGGERPTPHLTAPERERAAALAAIGGAAWAAASMELGAMVCTARLPQCDACPISDACAWRTSGYPPAAAPARRQARFEGSDRQCRGAVMAAVRNGPVDVDDFAWPDAGQLLRAVASLEAEGLLARSGSLLRLPG